MALFEAYRERVKGISELFPPNESRLRMMGAKLFALVAAIEVETWRTFPITDSPEVMWERFDRVDLEKELQELLDEPKSIS